ncbi:hypothetical protein [Yinghuangia sp. YIM S09857]|uniref:hypothetical protein n=1 Tax=Yinghuangia sp. YIM S09857 TaxID=3436929 RepID=UPI003F53CE57
MNAERLGQPWTVRRPGPLRPHATRPVPGTRPGQALPARLSIADDRILFAELGAAGSAARLHDGSFGTCHAAREAASGSCVVFAARLPARTGT